jgi:Lon protease-like protein
MPDPARLPDIANLPVFPLPGMTLFPHTHLPLHVFEPRYRALMEDTLAQPEARHCFAMGTLLDTPGNETLGDPPVHRVVGVGRIIEFSRLPDGRFMLVLQGIGRARLTREFDMVRGYRVFEALWLADVLPPWPGTWATDLMAELKTLALALLREEADKFRKLVAAQDELGRLTDLICGYLPLPPDFKLEQLACLNVMERAARTISKLEAMLPARGKPLRLDTDPPAN